MKDGFCPSCGSSLEMEWKRGKLARFVCRQTKGVVEGMNAQIFGVQLTAKKPSKTNGLLSPSSEYFCGGCGKKLPSRPSKDMHGLFDITTNCTCGRCWDGHLLADLVLEMEDAHPKAKKEKKQAPKKTKKKEKLDMLALAKRGDVEKIVSIAGDDEEDDQLAYKWLCIAADFGHEEASDAADDLLETSSLRYDDDQLVTPEIHLEIAALYEKGKEGLARDPVKAKKHRAIAKKVSS